MLIHNPFKSRDMDDIFVGQLMSSPVHTVAPETPIHEAAEQMLNQDIGSLVVADEDDWPEGILTATDFVRLAADQQSPDDTTVKAYATTVITTATVNDPLREAADTMMDDGIHHLPVVDEEDGLLGMLTSTDLTAYLSPAWTPSPP